MTKFKKMVLSALLFLGVASTGMCALTDTAGVVLDNNQGGAIMKEQFKTYCDARDKVVDFQQGNLDLKLQQVIDLVLIEANNGVKSYVRGNCFNYLGDLLKNAGQLELAKEAWKDALKYATDASTFEDTTDEKTEVSQHDGKLIMRLASKKLKKN